MIEGEKPHSKFRHVYAVMRIDLPVSRDIPENNISVVKVFSSEMNAQQEMDRFNNIDSGNSCRYVLRVTRLVPGVN